MDNTAKLTQWAINKIKTEYPDDIALLIACRGHETDNDGHGVCFDYFIPITQRGCELSQTFLVDGVGHDLYPRSWERMEKSTTLDEMTCVLANAEIRYARSQADIDRFCALQQTLKDNLKDPVFVYRKALERLDDAMDIYRSLMFEEKMYRARSEAGYIQHYLSQAVAYINGTYAESAIFTENQAYGGNASNRLYHCPELATVPDSFFRYAERSVDGYDTTYSLQIGAQMLLIHIRFSPRSCARNSSIVCFPSSVTGLIHLPLFVYHNSATRRMISSVYKKENTARNGKCSTMPAIQVAGTLMANRQEISSTVPKIASPPAR